MKLGQTLGSKGREKTRNKIVPTKVPRPTLAEKNLGTAAGARVSERMETLRRWKVGVWSEVAGRRSKVVAACRWV